jgi:hypothetical protein
MVGVGLRADLAVAVVNAVLLALWVVLPALFFGYFRQSAALRRARPEFSLRKSEAEELDRAVQLYERARSRLAELRGRDEAATSFRHVLLRRVRRPERSAELADEIDDLEAHANHLRAMMRRLQWRPIQRLKAWVHLMSAQFALRRSLFAYFLGLIGPLAALYVYDQPAWARQLSAGLPDMPIWYPLDERLFYANGLAAAVVAVVAPISYLARRARLRNEHLLEFCALKEFALTDPDQVILQPPDGTAGADTADEAAPPVAPADDGWTAVLGVAPSATVGDVKEAYKTLIKQNHPDRVHGMSPAFRTLAETETRRLNAAYRDALLSLRPLALEREAAES